ncbi:unnamed protein product [Amoebophrya sp. A120]|nr:unnamed protein product [Amoebophrya sp. A120]|eukprot:GSA120T00025390001.1
MLKKTAVVVAATSSTLEQGGLHLVSGAMTQDRRGATHFWQGSEATPSGFMQEPTEGRDDGVDVTGAEAIAKPTQDVADLRAEVDAFATTQKEASDKKNALKKKIAAAKRDLAEKLENLRAEIVRLEGQQGVLDNMLERVDAIPVPETTSAPSSPPTTSPREE